MFNIGAALIGTSITACVIIIVALFTPGWYVAIETYRNEYYSYEGYNEYDMLVCLFNVSVCFAYMRLCFERSTTTIRVQDYLFSENVCTTLSLLGLKETNVFAAKHDTKLRWVAEGLGCLIAITVGCILAVSLGNSIRRRNINKNSSISNCIAIFGLVFSVIGAICGIILATDFITFHNLDNQRTKPPYSVIIFFFGLFVQVVATIFHMMCIKTHFAGIQTDDRFISSSINDPYTAMETNFTGIPTEDIYSIISPSNEIPITSSSIIQTNFAGIPTDDSVPSSYINVPTIATGTKPDI